MNTSIKQSYHQSEYKMLGIFNALLIVSLLLCDVFIFKVVDIFGFNIAASGCIFPLTFLMLICINETYGHKYAAISLVNLVIAQFAFLVGLILIAKVPSPSYNYHLSHLYQLIFKNEWRVFPSSIIGISVALYISSFINSKLKIFTNGRFLMGRIIANAIITKAILVSIIYPINFYGLIPFTKIIKICLNTYVFKLAMSVAIVYISHPIVFFSKLVDKKYVFDYNTKFSPNYIYSAESEGVNTYNN